MKEILFRGKTASGEWIESDCIMQFKPHPFYERDMIQLWQEGNGWTECDRASVGQFTGLTDTHGTCIFEGDIVSGLLLFGLSVNAVVTFQDGAFGLEWNRGKAKTFDAFTSICNVKYEVIGNIYDDPELLN